MITEIDEYGDIVVRDYDYPSTDYGYLSIEELIELYTKAGYDISITKKDTQIKDD